MALENLFPGRQTPQAARSGAPATNQGERTKEAAPVTTAGSYRVQRVKADVRQAIKKYETRKTEKDLIVKQRDDAILRKLEAEKSIGVYDLVQIILQKSSDYARQQVKARIEEIVTSALNVVLDQSYRFFMVLETRSNRPEADYFLESNGVVTQLQPPDYDRGGGAVDIVSLALRLAIAELCDVRGTLWLDEVGKHVSAEYAPNVAYFLKQYSQQFNRQIVLITHNTALAEIGDVSLDVRRKNGRSGVSVL